MSVYADLFLTFVKIGLFTFGGGYAMLSVIENICVEGKKWISHEEMMNITVLAESTPGPIAINCATFVGYKKKGVAGAVVSTLGVVLPSFVIIGLIAFLLDDFLEIEIVAKAFSGIKIAVGILIVGAAIKMIKQMKRNIFSLTVVIVSFGVMLAVDMFSLGFSSIIMMLIAGLISLMVTAIIGDKHYGYSKDGDIK